MLLERIDSEGRLGAEREVVGIYAGWKLRNGARKENCASDVRKEMVGNCSEAS